MNIKMINQKSLKIILEKDELEKISINSKDIDSNSPKIKRAVSSLLDLLKFEYGIHIKKEQKIAVEITHTKDEQFSFLFNCDNYILGSEFETYMNSSSICVLNSNNINDIINASKALNTNVLFKSFKTQSSLYKTKENYKLLTKCPHEDISSLMIILSEFGTIQTLKENHISCFSENINRIIENDAIDILSIL